MPGPGTLGKWYEPRIASTELAVFRDQLVFTKAADDARLLVITDIQALSDATRQAVAGNQPLAGFDDSLELEEWNIRDRLDYYTYPTRVENLTIADGAWFTPDSVNSFCGEDGADVAGNSIDGLNNTTWRHAVNERHSVIYQLRGYPKKISKIRFRYNSTEPITEQLANLDVHAAKNVANIDNAENILETGINITWPTGQGSVWVEHTLAGKKNNARFVKLLFDTAHASNTSQVREFAVWVETRQVGDLF